MGNTNMDLLYPEFWAQSFEEIHPGKYNLHNNVSRKLESVVGQFGDQVNVPITPSSVASDYDGGEVTTTDDITQATVPVKLDKSKKANFTLSGKDYSLSPYDLIQSYGVSKAESIIRAVNDDLYLEMLKGTNFGVPINFNDFQESSVIAIKDGLDKLKADDINRVLVVSPSAENKLLARPAFQYVNYSGTDQSMKLGIVDEKFGFKFVPNHSISKYTPADVAGACAAADLNATEITVTAFDDDAKPVRIGDMLTIADDTTVYTVTGTTLTSGDTTKIKIFPALAVAIAAAKVVTITPSESAVGMHKSAIALASRGYAELPSDMGVRSKVINYKGLPIRVSVWASGLVIKVQFDILYGCQMVHNDRLYRLHLK
jgi:hypothetical protein